MSDSVEKKRAVLVVEDDAFLRDLIVHKLVAAGYAAEIAADGEEALSLAIKNPPDLILLDLILPGISGFELVAKLRQNAPTAKTPFFILSNSSEEPNKREGEVLGAEGYLVKAQTTPGDIVAVVSAWFARRAA